ncbi:MAG: hypothetical protein DMG53_00415 [Acidobacteria bacterium]|nr:MAG: hypothetical protein DMG53_00415 [Acidobacteriota bacterium]
MQAIVHQLGELFLQAVPTVLTILLFYFILRALFFKPLLQVMAERDSRTVGADQSSVAAQAAANRKVKQYQQALEQARGGVYAEQEAARRRGRERLDDAKSLCSGFRRCCRGVALSGGVLACRRRSRPRGCRARHGDLQVDQLFDRCRRDCLGLRKIASAGIPKKSGCH